MDRVNEDADKSPSSYFFPLGFPQRLQAVETQYEKSCHVTQSHTSCAHQTKSEEC